MPDGDGHDGSRSVPGVHDRTTEDVSTSHSEEKDRAGVVGVQNSAYRVEVDRADGQISVTWWEPSSSASASSGSNATTRKSANSFR